MPITSSAKKALRASKHKHVFNMRRKNAMKTAVKDIQKIILAKKPEEAAKLIPQTYQAIDKAEKRGIIKKNTASRKKSRLMKMLKRAGA